jgi:hypothetical protein
VDDLNPQAPEAEDPNPSPYKFLDYYTLEDRDIFFGRERETDILISDVLVSRLVVLFAKTGTGKTSLINAGVRPILEDREYTTFFIRVRADPELSAELHIKEHESAPPWEGKTLAEKLIKVRKRLKQPLVLFFDQFEEFFLYTRKEQPSRADDFVKNIAALYNNPESGIHIVFSMREEWFVEMDVFRTLIPKIFHNESNLRLRWFDREQTFDAIRLPARAYNVEMEDALVERLYRDLAVNGLVEPARLQIVCDTLWRETADELTLNEEHYKKLGDENKRDSIATQVLFRRLEEEFGKLETERELQLLYALLPLLSTEDDTKYVRDIDSLVELLLPTPEDPEAAEAHAADRETFLGLLGKLEDARFIRRGKREQQDVIELSHDYLVSNLKRLRKRVRTIWPRRRLRAAMEQRRHPSLEDFVTISDVAAVLTVSKAEAKLLFRTALAYGATIELEHLETWFHKAHALKVSVWNMLRKQLRDRYGIETSKMVVDLLARLAAGRLGGGAYGAQTLKRLREQAHSLLERALTQEALAAYTFVMLGYVQTREAVEILSRALKQEVYAPHALDALYRVANSQKNPAASAYARETLWQFWRDSVRSRDRLAPVAIESLWRVEELEAVSLLEEALDDEELAPVAQSALERLSKASADDVARAAHEVVMKFLRRSLQRPETAPAAVESLGGMATQEAVEYLVNALGTEALVPAAMSALGRLAGSASTEVAEAANRALMNFLPQAVRRDALAPTAVELLGRVQRAEAVALLKEAAEKSQLAAAARASLEKLSRSSVQRVASEAAAALNTLQPTRQAGVSEASAEHASRVRASGPSLTFIKKLLNTGQIIPFLGPGAALADRPPDAIWHRDETRFLPNAPEMARFLAEESFFPPDDGESSFDVLKVASYYAEVMNQVRLNERLREIYDRDYPVGQIHRFLARVGAPLLIFTTAFDDLLERAFVEAKRPYDVVFHPAGRAELMGSILLWRHGEKEPQPIAPNRLFVDLSSRTVIYKIFGSVDRAGGTWDSFCITEADCVNILSRFTSGVGLPPLFARQLRSRPFLYLGSGLRHWNQRVLLKILKSAAAGGRWFAAEEAGAEPTSYAVQHSPARLEAELWKAKRVKIYDMDLNEFVRCMDESPEA